MINFSFYQEKIDRLLNGFNVKIPMILNLNKPIGWTSFDVCKKVKGITKERKVGHGGTLDPFASGVLIVGTGKDTKALNIFSNKNKSYRASISLGVSN